MPQIFSPKMNIVAKVSILGGVLSALLLVWAGLVYTRSSYGTGVAHTHEQAVPFSHEHHAGVLGIDCRYCHSTVEVSAVAGIPPTKTCMNCHWQIWVGSELLEPVRESYRRDVPLRWQRVHNLPGFVYFDHSIHVQKGMGCSTCHGRVDQMPLMYQASSLLMEWCLDCHRHPEQQIRPRAEVFNMQYVQPNDPAPLGLKLVKEYAIRSATTLTSCTVCHR
jgi:hypothetical protein